MPRSRQLELAFEDNLVALFVHAISDLEPLTSGDACGQSMRQRTQAVRFGGLPELFAVQNQFACPNWYPRPIEHAVVNVPPIAQPCRSTRGMNGRSAARFGDCS